MKVLFFETTASLYNVLHFFSERLCNALRRRGVAVTSVDPSKISFKDLQDLCRCENFSYIINLGGLTFFEHDSTSLLCDRLKIPHFSWLVDLPLYYRECLSGAYSIIGQVEGGASAMEGVDASGSVFLPHCADVSQYTKFYSSRPYEVVFFGSCQDYKAIKDSWRYRYSKKISKMMEDIAEAVLLDHSLSFLDTFWDICKNNDLDSSSADIVKILIDTEWYLRGKARISLISSIDDINVHIWGRSPEFWGRYFGNKSNVFIHHEVDHKQALDIMSKSKILLNSVPSFSSGSHERIFEGILSGCFVVTDDKPFVREQFSNKEALFYNYNNLCEIEDLLKSYLSDTSDQEESILQAQDKVLKEHTWDARVKTLLDELPKMSCNMQI